MHCTSCGTPILPGMKHCPHCGALIAPTAPGADSTQAAIQQGTLNDANQPAMNFGPYMESASVPPPGQQAIPPLQSNAYDAYGSGISQNAQPANFYTTGTQPGVPYSNPNPLPPAGTPSYGLPGYNAGQPPYVPPQAYSASQQPLPAQPPKRAGGLSRGLTITLIVLVLLVLIGSGIIYYFSIPYPAQVHAQATATAQGLANNQATGTAVVIHNTNATATAQTQATVTAQQSIYNSATNGSPAVTDSLSQNDGLRWDQYDNSNSDGCVYAGGSYHVKELQSGYFQTCMAQTSNFSNFTLQVQMTILRGDFGGIIFRSSATSPKFYLLQFGVDGTYDLLGYISNNGNDAHGLLSSVTPAMKGLNEPNLITLIARGSQLTIFVNKQYVDTVNDTLYKGGQIGFMAYYKASPAEVAYSNMQIWQL